MAIRPHAESRSVQLMKVETLVGQAQGPMFLLRSLLGYHLIPRSALTPWILAFSGSMEPPERARRPLRTPSPGPARSVASSEPASSARATKSDCSNPKLIFTTIAYQLGQLFSHYSRTKVTAVLRSDPEIGLLRSTSSSSKKFIVAPLQYDWGLHSHLAWLSSTLLTSAKMILPYP
jgi:hypothetical protein